LGVLLTTVKEEQVLEIADSLADQVLDASKSELRDVYAIGLRTLVKTIPPNMGELASNRLVGRLLDGIRTSHKDEIVLACLDILTDLLGRFGATALSVTRQHEPILQMCLHQLNHSSPVVRKRAGNTIGCLSVVLSDALLVSMVDRLLSCIASSEKGRKPSKGSSDKPPASGISAGDTRALIRTMCTVSGAVGHRLGQVQIDRILPIFLRFTDPEDAVTGDDEDYDGGDGDKSDTNDEDVPMETADDEDEAGLSLATELREACFMGFESFVLRCPTQVEPHLESIVQAALAYMSYDPNYSYGVEDDEEGMNGGNDDDGDDEYDDDDNDNEFEEEEAGDEDDDDDDESWKVRRSAIRALKAVVEAKKHDPSALWTTPFKVRRDKTAILAAALVGRFKEREENCRVGVLDCFTRLLSVTVTAASAGLVTFDTTTIPTTPASASATCIDLRTKYAPSLVKECEKLLSVKKGGERSKSKALALLSTLCKAPGGVGGQSQIISVFQHVQSFLGSGNADYAIHREASSKTLRLDALSLIHAMLACDNHDPVHVRRGLRQTLLPQLCSALQEQWYKVIAQALRALAAVPRFFIIGYSNDNSEGETTSSREAEMREVAKLLYEAVEPVLAAHDVDQEIKECALTACASLLSDLHSSLTKEQTSRLLDLLLERLNNETTRIAAIKTLSAIAAASSSTDGSDESMPDASGADKIDLSPILADSVSTMASFLKLQSRSLKQSSLEALDTVVRNHGVADSEDLYAMLLKEVSQLVVDSDLHISHLSL
jgi:cullin-associated NEDD8-dissociated protein 1